MKNFHLPTGRPDFALLATTGALVFIGVIFVYSASFAIALAEFGNVNFFLFRHLVALVLGIGALLFFMSIDYQHLRRFSPAFMLVAVLSLGLVLVFGSDAYGARRWIDLGPMQFQPSEFAKLALIIYVSAWLASSRRNLSDFGTGVAPFIFVMGIVAGLILLEPDTGTAAIVVMTTLALFFLAGGSLVHVGALLGAGGVAGLLLLLTGGYRMDRIMAFTSAENDPSGVGFQTLQLLIALGSGGLEGLGLGVSRQKFYYIPGAHSDGIFAIIGEEVGLIGATIVLGLFAYFVYRGILVALRARDDFGTYLAMGIVFWIAFQALINIGGVTRTIPLTGITLPFVSYGGSSLIMVLAGVGVLLSVSRHSRENVPERRGVRKQQAIVQARPRSGVRPSPTTSSTLNEGQGP